MTSAFLNYAHSEGDACGWENRYRPKTLDDVLLPQVLKTKLQAFRDHQAAPALLFYGPAGTGKTTTALTLNPDQTFHFNASDLNDRDIKSSAFYGALTTVSLFSEERHRRKVVILDEADALTERAQQSLRSIVEQCASSAWFVFVVNSRMKMIEPIQSRTYPIGFGFPEYAEEMENLMVGRCLEVLRKEERTMEEAKVRELVRIYGPDMRQILIQLQVRTT